MLRLIIKFKFNEYITEVMRFGTLKIYYTLICSLVFFFLIFTFTVQINYVTMSILKTQSKRINN